MPYSITNLTAEEKKDYIVCKAIGDYYIDSVNYREKMMEKLVCV